MPGSRPTRGKDKDSDGKLSDNQEGASTQGSEPYTELKEMVEKMQTSQTLLLTKFDEMNSNIESIKTTVGSVDHRITEIENWINERDAFENSMKAKTDKIEGDVTTMNDEITMLKEKIKELESNHSNLYEHTLKLECQSRRDNLVIHGIPESDRESDYDCYSKVVNIMKNELGITNADEIRIARCHRLGPRPQDRDDYVRPRPVIFKLHWFGDRSLLWSRKDRLDKTQFFLSENYPPEIEQRRRKLLPFYKAAKLKNMFPKLAVDKLIIAGKIYTVSNIDEIPEYLTPEAAATPSKNNITAFFSKFSPLSNFYHVKVTDEDGTEYISNEQFYQHRKALYHSDDLQATAIMRCKSSHAAYLEGKKVKGQHTSDWHKKEMAKKQMLKCCMRKFSAPENSHLKEFLLKTGDTDIVEASPTDKYWGVGIKITDPAIFDKAQWTGSRNIMGEILENVRSQLK